MKAERYNVLVVYCLGLVRAHTLQLFLHVLDMCVETQTQRSVSLC